MTHQNQILSTIDGLIETLKDGQKGYKEAADAVTNPQLKSLFGEYSQQRSRFAAELQGEARLLGNSKPETDSSASGAMHRAWINLRAAISSKDDHAILAECERGEDSAVHEYDKAINTPLSAPVNGVVQRQYGEIKNAHDKIRSLRDWSKN